MKKIKLLFTIVFALGFGVAGFGQFTTDTILYWRFANPVIISGTPSYAQFDVEISAEFSGTWHTDLQFYFNYNSDAFGFNIVQNSKVTYEKLEMLAGDFFGTPKYVIYGPQDNTASRFAILSEASFKIIGTQFMNEVPQYPTFAGYLRITIEIADDTELAGINFAEPLMDGWQYFISNQHPLQGQIPWKYNNPCTYENDLNNWALTPQLENLYISEVVDPNTPNANAKFVELFNGESFDVDLGAFQVFFCRQANGTTWNYLALTATIPAGGTYVIGYQATPFQTAYGTDADIYSTYCSGNGDDGYFLYLGSGDTTVGTLYDAYGVMNEDGTGKPWEYTDGHAVRKRTVSGPNTTWTASEWTIVRSTSGVILTGSQMTPWGHKETRTWAGTTSTDWNAKGNNWDDTGYVPDASDIVLIPNTVNDPVVTLHSACHDLTIQAAAQWTQNSNTFMTVNGTLTNNAGVVKRLILKSDASNTASLLQTTSGVNGTAERYLSQSQWHYISSPISDGQSIIYNNIYLKSWDEPTAAWTYIVPTNVALDVMEGYASFPSPLYTGNTTVEHTGTLNVGALNISTTFTAGAPEANRGWNFVGNPYTTAINWMAAGWTKTNIKDKIQMWNPTAGNYGVFDNTVIPATSTNGVDSIIPQTNGFFVDNVDGQATGTLGVTDAVRLHSSKAFFKGSDYLPEGILKLSVHNNGYWDESVIRFAEISGNLYDEYDTPKWDGIEEAPQLYTMDNTGFRYSINTLPGIEENEVIPLGFSINEDGIYTVNVEGVEFFDATIPVYIEDVVTGEFQNLRANPSYTFSYSAGEEPHRFNLHFASPYGIGENGLPGISVYSFDSDVYVSVPEISGYVHIYNIMGQEVVNERIISNLSKYTLETEGYYMVTVVDGEQISTTKVYIK